MKSNIIAGKKHSHWAERQYLKYPTILNKLKFNKAKNSMVKIMQKECQNLIYLKLTQRLQKEFVCHMQQTVRI